ALASRHGHLIPDTKLEFVIVGVELLFIHECWTRNTSRCWSAYQYVTGQKPPTCEKQFDRDYLETLDWNKTPPAPSLPKHVIAKTSAKYVEAFRRLTSEKLL